MPSTRVTARAAELCLSVPRFLMESGMDNDGGPMPATVRNDLVAEFVGARTVIARAGVNLNQVAARLNATGQVSPPQLVAVLEAVARGLARLETAVEELRR